MISTQEIEKLASLSRILLSAEEKEKFRTDMDAILAYVAQIQKAGGAEFGATNPEQRNVFRDDSNAHESGIFTELILVNAPARDGQYVKVKKIL